MKGVNVDFDSLKMNESLDSMKPKLKSTLNHKRVDLSNIAGFEGAQIVSTKSGDGGVSEEFIKFDIGEGQDYEALNYNHRLRRKLRRAIEACQIRKELLVRERVSEICRERGIETPVELSTSAKPIHERGQRSLENGTLETSKGERVRLRIELAEFNKAARVLRKQAKEIAMVAGLRVHAEMTGKIAARRDAGNGGFSPTYGAGWYVPVETPVANISHLDITLVT